MLTMHYSDIYNCPRRGLGGTCFTCLISKSFAACEVVTLKVLYLFFISGCLAWQHVSAGRPVGEMWISLYESTGLGRQ